MQPRNKDYDLSWNRHEFPLLHRNRYRFYRYCIPRPGENWPSITSLERCQKSESIAYVQGPFGVLSDIYIFILPLPVLWRLQMTLRNKLGVSSIFLVGFMYVHFKPVSMVDPIFDRCI